MKKVILILTVVAWITSASITDSQQKTAAEKSVTTPLPPPVSSPVYGKLDKVAGTIERVDDTGRVFVVKGKKDRLTFVVDDKTKIVRGAKDMPFSDLKSEMGVAVDYRMEGERNIAVTIRVAAPKAVPREKVPEAPPESPRK